MERIQKYFEKNSYHQIRIFKIFLSLWIIYNSLTLGFKGDYFWGDYAYKMNLNFYQMSLLTKSLNLLEHPFLQNHYMTFIFFQIICCLLIILNRWSLISSILLLFLTWILDNRIRTTLDGGNNLVHLLLFFSIFMQPRLGKQGYWRLYLANMGLFLCQLQLVMVYFVAGHLKLAGDLWPAGTALYYTFNVDEYSHPVIQYLMNHFPLFSVIGSYFTLAFQLSFPFLIWFKKLRPIYFFIGTFLHLGISLGMGLMSFGLAMIMSYSVFYSKEKAKSLYMRIFGQNKIIVTIDEECNLCRFVKKILIKFDWHNQMTFDNARWPSSSSFKMIPFDKRLKRMHIFDSKRKVYFSGMEAIIMILDVLSIFPLSWPLKLMNMAGIGEVFYDKFIAAGKFRQKCIEGECRL